MGIDKRSTRFDPAGARYVLRRIVWLVVVPTASGFGAWGPIVVDSGSDAIRCAVSAVIPGLGLAAVVGYRLCTRDEVRMKAFLPFGLAAAAYLLLMLDLADELAREPDAAVIPVAQFGLGLLIPWLALIGGLVALVPPSFGPDRPSRHGR